MARRAKRAGLAAMMISAALLAMSPQQAEADGYSGAYLAARQAHMLNDFKAAAQYYTIALTRDAGNADIMESLILSEMALGNVSKAAVIARALESDGQSSQLGQLSLAIEHVKAGEYAALIERIGAGDELGPLLGGLTLAWAEVGAGDMRAAQAHFDKVIEGSGTAAFGTFHKALALAQVGDLESAEALLGARQPGSLAQTRRGVIARVQILSQLGRNDEALKLLADSFNGLDRELEPMKAAMEAGESLRFTLAATPAEGLAEVYFSIAGALARELPGADPLIFAQAARALSPEHVDASLLAASILEEMGQFEQATAVYRSVPAGHPAFHVAELGRAEALRRAGRIEAAVEVMTQLQKTHGDLAVVHSALGDLYRSEERFEEALPSYNRALELQIAASAPQWRTYYTRGIIYERLKEWDLAETDFRRALEINEGEPNVLNYLGYSLVEQGRKLDEALEMIERAVAARPQSGYIIDSLGWALFKLGRYDEAVPHMERAAELMSIDPVINDHLGDVYWAVGRKLEAEFQWRRALSFIDHGESSEDADPERIRRKLAKGLDAVLAEEGEAPLELAKDDG